MGTFILAKKPPVYILLVSFLVTLNCSIKNGVYCGISNARGIAEDHLDKARKSFDLGDYQDALKEYEFAYRQKSDPKILAHIGYTLLKLRQPSRALEFLIKYNDKSPNISDVDKKELTIIVSKIKQMLTRYGEGRKLYLIGRYREALELYEDAYRTTEEPFHDILVYMAQVFIAINEPERALEYVSGYREHVQQSKQDPEVYSLANEIERRAREMLNLNYPASVQIYPSDPRQSFEINIETPLGIKSCPQNSTTYNPCMHNHLPYGRIGITAKSMDYVFRKEVNLISPITRIGLKDRGAGLLTGGFILLGAGVSLLIPGIVIIDSANRLKDSSAFGDKNQGGALIAIGISALLGGTALAIAYRPARNPMTIERY